MSSEEANQPTATGDDMDTTNEANNEDDRKIFAGGLPQDVTDTDLKTHFGKFGDIETVSLKLDPNTGRSRGFAFIIFKASSAVEATVAVEDHTLKAKKIAVKRAQSRQGKVYVGKLKPELTDESIKEFFAQYGPIANLEHPVDKVKNEAKNFCFVTFEKEEHAKKLLKEGTVTINGVELEVKRVTQKQDQRGGYGGRGGAMGGGGGGWYPGTGYGGGDYYGWGGYGPNDYYGGGWGSWGPFGGDMNAYGGGGKTPRGGRGGGDRGRGSRGMRSKPY